MAPTLAFSGVASLLLLGTTVLAQGQPEKPRSTSVPIAHQQHRAISVDATGHRKVVVLDPAPGTAARQSSASNITVNGTVHSGAGGPGLPGVTVQLFDQATGNSFYSAPTDGGGLFEMSVPHARYDILVFFDGYTEWGATVPGVDATNPAATTFSQDFIMYPNDATVSGTFTITGQPASNPAAVLYLTSSFTPSFLFQVAIAGPAGGVYALSAKAGQYVIFEGEDGSADYDFRSDSFMGGAPYTLTQSAADVSFVLPSLTFTPMSCSGASCSLTVAGAGWRPNASMTIDLETLALTADVTAGSVSADSSGVVGSTTLTFAAPAAAVYRIVAFDTERYARTTATYSVSTSSSPPAVLLPSPLRAVDTRTGTGGFTGMVTPGTDRCFAIGGVGGVPANASGVIVNATAVGQSSIGWLTLYAAGQPVPGTSTLNYDPHEYAIANGAIVRLGSGGQVCVNAGNSPVFLVLDVAGYLTSTASSSLALLANSVRPVDTRNGTGGFSGPIVPGTDQCFVLAGVMGIPSNAAGVVVNVTGTGYGGNGWLTLYPNGQGRPSTSTLNFDTHEYAIANNAVLAIGSAGKVCVNVGASPSRVIVDVVGYVTSTGLTQVPLIAPERAVDTRSGLGGFTGQIVPGSDRCFTLGGVVGVPANATAVILNVTATGYGGNGWLTLYPNGQSLPSTSTINYDANEYAVANGAVIRLGTGGKICVDAGSHASQVIVDVTAYIP